MAGLRGRRASWPGLEQRYSCTAVVAFMKKMTEWCDERADKMMRRRASAQVTAVRLDNSSENLQLLPDDGLGWSDSFFAFARSA